MCLKHALSSLDRIALVDDGGEYQEFGLGLFPATDVISLFELMPG